MTDIPTKIRFHYIKSSNFRVVYATGAYGGLTPRGEVFISLYNERHAIPQITANAVTPEGQLGEEILEERKSKDGIVREVEVGIMMDVNAAESFHKWLGEKIQSYREIEGKRKNVEPPVH